MQSPRLRTALLSAIFAARLAAAIPPDPEPVLCDAYLAQASVTTLAYRTDLQRGGDPRRVPAGRRLGVSPTLGPFTYRPRSYRELTAAEQAALLRDPRFQLFAAAIRARIVPWKITLPAAEMLLPRPAFITLPAAPGVP